VKRKSRLDLRGREGLLLVTSLLLAVVIWFMGNLSRDYPGVLNVPVSAECNLQGHSNVSADVAIASARCRTNGYRLLREGTRRSRRPVRVRFERADVRHDAGDRFYVPGSALNNHLQTVFGDEVAVEEIISDTLFFTFPAEEHKKVPVHLSGDFSYRTQYMSSGPLRLVPDSVTVYGEKARLDLVDHVSTVPRVVDDVHDTQHGVLRLRRIKGVRLSDEQISYDLPVTRYVEVRSELPVVVENLPDKHTLDVFPSRATVILRCVFPGMRNPFEKIQPYIDYADFASSLSGRCVARIRELPPGVIDWRVEPAVFDCIETN